MERYVEAIYSDKGLVDITAILEAVYEAVATEEVIVSDVAA